MEAVTSYHRHISLIEHIAGEADLFLFKLALVLSAMLTLLPAWVCVNPK